ncbi:MAG TPA: NAD(P)-dependent oxidoreductase [Pseudonocardiaceae bacterium]
MTTGGSRVGWLGLGAMGLPMAARLIANGHPVRAFDPDPGRVASGAVACRTPAEAAAGVDIVALMVATPAQGEQALFGPDGAAGQLAAGTQVIVFSTVGPQAVRDWADRIAGAVVDAPVSGGVARAGAGELVIFVGGPRTPAVDQVLSVLATTVTDAGPEPGAGQLVKLVNQLLCGVHIAVAAEALDYAGALGLDPRMVLMAVRQGAAGSFMLGDRGQRMLDGPPATVRSAVDIFVKDLGLVRDEARRVGSHTPLADAAAALFEEAAAAGLGAADDSRVIEPVRRRRLGR